MAIKAYKRQIIPARQRAPQESSFSQLSTFIPAEELRDISQAAIQPARDPPSLPLPQQQQCAGDGPYENPTSPKV
jgi:hypothetical protein